MADNWYYAQNNQQLGPVPLATLQAMARSGQLNGEDLVWREGMANWTPANQVPGVFGGGAPAQAGGWQGPAMGGPAYAPAGQAGPPLGYRGQPQRYAEGSVPNYLVQSILATIFCCWPIGIVAIIYAAQVNSKLASGDYDGAVDASSKAKTWMSWSVGLGAGVAVLYMILVVIGGLAQS